MGDEQVFRIEHDSMGEVRVPATAKWRAQTQRAVENFPVSGEPIERALIEALGRIKAAAAAVNAELEVVDGEVAAAITEAAGEVAEGRWDEQFPVDVFQTGSGTSSNMNANEVIATLAAERLGRPVHPNDDVNASQSSNDVFPTAIHIAAASAVVRDLVPALEHLAAALERKSARVRRGRQGRPDAPDGRHPGHARPGVRRLRGADALRRGAAAHLAAAARGAAAGRHGGGHRDQHPARVRAGGDRPSWPRRPGCRWPRRATTSRRRARGTRSWRPPGRCGRSRSG